MTSLPPRRPDAKLQAAEHRLREVMLSLPEVSEEFPWGHRTAKVKGKMFAVLVLEDERLTVTTKLPQSNEAALMLPFAEPTGYGLGKSGWVTSTFKPGQAVPVELLSQWIHESFRAVAPQKVLKALDSGAPGVKNVVAKKPAPPKPPAKKKVVAKPAAKKPAARKAAVKKPAAAAKKAATTRRGTATASRVKR
ncbi:MmcQ/YjbR family DNA-binding protein [Pyxidicoccus xibeiensis]|uniref:MmcQ/YjbR family DNA-binding protein n=1 Tax=Pyxidicoccus xibeiensis TaxID=2906759 RepID=UPI0020A7DDE9|nr:MmcQ/YjbR family DNA-binding protein [Pyxidicoccus xibeiensis]MCP3139548.1 MmcQ/YjbR family DNA-binding protein [Pyxidicoccus xibeiensis]